MISVSSSNIAYGNKGAFGQAFDEKRMYTHVKAYASALGMLQTVRVLPYVREKHDGQFRKGADKVSRMSFLIRSGRM